MGQVSGRFDGHAHVFLSSLPMAEQRRYTPDYDASPEKYFSLLKQNKFDGALLIQPSFLGADNSYLLSVLEQFAGDQFPLLRGVVVLDQNEKIDIGGLKEWDQLGVIGVRLNVFRCESSFDYKDWEQVLNVVEKFGWHIELHCSSQYMPNVLPNLIAKHSKVVIDHLGLVDNIRDNAGLQCILSQPKNQIWMKVSALYRNFPNAPRENDLERSKPLRQLYEDHFGKERLIWGSDWPFTNMKLKFLLKIQSH